MRSTHENVFAEDTLAAHNIAAGDQTPAPIVKLGDRKRPAVELPRLRLWGGGVWRIFSIQKLLGLSASNQEHNKRLKMERPNTVASEDAGRPVWRGTARDGTARTGTAHLAFADTRQRVTPAGRTAKRSTPRLCSSAAPPGCSSAASGSATCRWQGLSPASRDWGIRAQPEA